MHYLLISPMDEIQTTKRSTVIYTDNTIDREEFKSNKIIINKTKDVHLVTNKSK